MPDYDYGPIDRDAEWSELQRLLAQSFEISGPTDEAEKRWKGLRALIGDHNFRVLRDPNRLLGGLGNYPVAQYFGGRAVPMAAVAVVGIRPEARGRGLGAHLMSELLRELHGQGVALSTLYASTARLYRGVGYERAGSCCRFSLDLRHLGRHPRDLEVTSVEPTHGTIRTLYDRVAPHHPGHLDRGDAMWTRMTRTIDHTVYAFLAGPASAPEGYVLLTQPPHKELGFLVSLREIVTTTPAATRRLLALIADHRSMSDTLRWTGPYVDPLLAYVEDAFVDIVEAEHWMTRIVDVESALSERGYPAGVEATLDLAVDDPLIDTNNRPFRLEVGDGAGRVTRGGEGDLSLSIRALAPLYTGFLTARQLAGLGWIRGPRPALEAAERIFAGTEPWMPDRF